MVDLLLLLFVYIRQVQKSNVGLKLSEKFLKIEIVRAFIMWVPFVIEESPSQVNFPLNFQKNTADAEKDRK